MLKTSTCVICLLLASPLQARVVKQQHHGSHHHATAAGGHRPAPATTRGPAALSALIDSHARAHGIPPALVHRVVQRESRYNPAAHNRAYWGLMQIRYDTAQSMGYRGSPRGLLDANTNLTYAVPYLANAYLVAGGNMDRAVQLYAGGYYYAAKRKGVLARLRTAASASGNKGAPVAAAAGDDDIVGTATVDGLQLAKP